MMNTASNPISQAIAVLEAYRAFAHDALISQKLSPEDVVRILASFEVDRGLYVSLNREYKRSDIDFRRYCAENNLARQIPDLLPHLASGSLFMHQEEAIRSILRGSSTVLSTGTGSGKTETFLIPAIDYCLRHREPGIKALIIYPMNALANDQLQRISKALNGTDISYGVYVGSTPESPQQAGAADDYVDTVEGLPGHDRNKARARRLGLNHRVFRAEMRTSPPDILITNYVMLDWLLTNPDACSMFTRSRDTLRYIILDELHVYRGSNAAHLKYLLRRLKSHLGPSLIHIGTSATLARGESTPPVDSCYLDASQDPRLATFVRGVLDVEDFAFHEATYMPEPFAELTPDWPLSQAQFPSQLLDPQSPVSVDEDGQWERFSTLVGERITQWDLPPEASQISDSKPYKALARQPAMRLIRRALLDGPQSIRDMAAMIARMSTLDLSQATELVHAYLGAAAFLNHRAGSEGKAFLDFRVHLFVREIAGFLTRCLKCGRFHAGQENECPDCGYPLFRVYRGNIDACIGKVSGTALRWELQTQSDDQDNRYFVLIERRVATSADDAAVGCIDMIAIPEQGQFRLESDPKGEYRLTLLQVDASEIDKQCIAIGTNMHDWEGVLTLARSIFDDAGVDKRMLAFVDNRAKASRLSTVLRDEFISAFFEECLRFFSPHGRQLDLVRTRDLLVKRLEEADWKSPYKKAVAMEFDLWYWRYLSVPPRLGGPTPDILRFKDDDLLSDAERDIVQVFIEERALAKPTRRPDEETRLEFIRFQTERAWRRRGIHLGGADSSDPDREAMALSAEKTAVHFPAVLRVGLRVFLQAYLGYLPADAPAPDHDAVQRFFTACTLEAVHEVLNKAPDKAALTALLNDDEDKKQIAAAGAAYVRHIVDKLCQRGLLKAEEVEGGRLHYYLPVEHLHVELPSTTYSTFRALAARLFLIATLHSSEVDPEKREEAEHALREGDANLVVATPTLEMGIDIGALQYVLCIGAPPLPSNYAQRAGRAGRGNKRYALIVTYCQDRSYHDQYYFRHPEKMIAGQIPAPQFNPDNVSVVKRHLNAFVMDDCAKSIQAVRAFRANIDIHFARRAKQVAEMFPPCIDLAEHKRNLTQELDSLMNSPHRLLARNGIRNLLYDKGVFPDYNFRRDEVLLIDRYKLDKEQGERPDYAALSGHELDRATIARRVPELAVHHFVPGSSVYTADDVYTATADGLYVITGWTGNLEVRSYGFLVAERRIADVGRNKPLVVNSLSRHFTASSAMDAPTGRIVTHYYDPALEIRVTNGGVRTAGGVRPFTASPTADGGERSFALGTCLKRAAIVLAFDHNVCADETYMYSLAAALVHAINRRYQLQDGEVSVLVGVAPDGRDFPPRQTPPFVLLYDTNGSGNAPLRIIAAEFSDLAQAAYNALIGCDCEDGCYRCLRSYGMQFSAPFVSKAVAAMFTGFLCGKNPFMPSMEPFPAPRGEEWPVRLVYQKKQLHATAYGYTFTSAYSEHATKGEVIRYLIDVLSRIDAQEHPRIVVHSQFPYIVTAINGKKLKDQGVFNALLFAGLRFRSLTAQQLTR